MRHVSIRQRLPRDVTWIVGVACALNAAMVLASSGLGYDSHAYWLTGQPGESYGRAPNTKDAFLYSPAFAQVLWPLTQLPWPVFAVLFAVLPAVVFAWLLWPLPWQWAVPLWLATLPEIVNGNVYWLLALVAVVGMQRPGTWVIAALTKITPCLGPIWFLARREWRDLARSLVVITTVALLSMSLDARAWWDWFAFLGENLAQSNGDTTIAILPPLVVRLPLAVALVVYAARTGRTHLIPLAMVVSTPVLFITSFTMLAAIPRLVRREAMDVPDDRKVAAPMASDKPWIR